MGFCVCILIYYVNTSVKSAASHLITGEHDVTEPPSCIATRGRRHDGRIGGSRAAWQRRKTEGVLQERPGKEFVTVNCS